MPVSQANKDENKVDNCTPAQRGCCIVIGLIILVLFGMSVIIAVGLVTAYIILFVLPMLIPFFTHLPNPFAGNIV